MPAVELKNPACCILLQRLLQNITTSERTFCSSRGQQGVSNTYSLSLLTCEVEGRQVHLNQGCKVFKGLSCHWPIQLLPMQTCLQPTQRWAVIWYAVTCMSHDLHTLTTKSTKSLATKEKLASSVTVFSCTHT